MSKKTDSSVFERYPKIAIGVISLVVISMIILVTELALRKFMGLGNPVLYSSYPLYGYRLVPNQEVSRLYGSVIKVNNLGLRASGNWDHRVRNKILFLGDSVTYGGSYISNDELFSSLATQNIPGYESGNAGVNAWGVENIHGLIVNSEFLPASVYVSVLPEEDFYRGLTRLEGRPYWCRKPSLAFQELLYFFYHQQGRTRFVSWRQQVDEEGKKRVVERAAMKFKEMDEFLKARGFWHLIYISPTREQLLHSDTKNELVQKMLGKYNLNVTYLLDRLHSLELSTNVKETLFHDRIHLEKEGHRLWGKFIGDDLVKLINP